MTKVPLGVVVPTLNAARTLDATLTALEPIVAAGADVLLVDGGSADATLDIATKRGYRFLNQPGGLYSALNVGFRQLSTEWLTWINADDLLYEDTVSQRLENHGNASVLYGRVDFIDFAGRFMHSWASAPARDLLRLYRGGYSPLLQQGTLFRNTVFKSLDGFNESYCLVGDADFWWRALEAGYVFQQSKHPPVAAFRLHGSQLSQIHKTAMLQEHHRMVSAHGGRACSIRSVIATCMWRAGNLPSYLMRSLRRHQLDGRLCIPSSYDISRSVD
jgi:glycosyltransferase involved in cell wall biosynthesis